jgi:hypothetical protein
VDTDDKKKYRFMIGLSTKLLERMTLNTGGSFPEFLSNVIITDDAIHAHKDVKKRKAVAAPSSSAPPKYQTVYHLHAHLTDSHHWRPLLLSSSHPSTTTVRHYW